jgi:hypothetical protein
VSVGKLLPYVSLGFAGLSVLIALFALVHELVDVAGGPRMLVYGLEQWVLTMGYHVALILLAAAGVVYLTRKG